MSAISDDRSKREWLAGYRSFMEYLLTVRTRECAQRTGLFSLATGAAVTILLAGCSSSSKTSSTTPTPSVTSKAPTTAPSTTPATTPPASITPTPTASTPPPEPANLCTLAELAVTAGQAGGAAGSVYQPILFRNTSSRTCQLQGYPGVAAINAAGQQASQAIRTPSLAGGGLPAAQTLAPGTVVSAIVRGSNVPVGGATSCVTFTLLVTPPGETHSQPLAAKLPGCARLGVGFVVAGQTGQKP